MNTLKLEAKWFSDDYACKGQSGIEEKVRIEKDGRSLVAKMLVGNECVSAGRVSWRAELPKKSVSKEDLPVTLKNVELQELKGGSLTFRSVSGKIEAVNRIKIEDLVFKPLALKK